MSAPSRSLFRVAFPPRRHLATLAGGLLLAALHFGMGTPVHAVDSVRSDSTSSSAPLLASVDLGVTKTVDDTSPPEGATILYTVTVANAGPDSATGVEVTDVLPTGVTFVSATTTQGTYAAGTGLWTVDSVAVGASDTLWISAMVDSGTAGQLIVNEVILTASDQTDTNPANNMDIAVIAVVSVDLALTKTVDNPLPSVGGTIVYTLSLTNNSAVTATGVQVTDVLPAGVTFVSATPSQGHYSSATGIWNVGSVSGPKTLQITATVDEGTGGQVITNTASVTDVDQPDTDPANDSDSVDITVRFVDLAVTKTVDDPAPNEGDTVLYTVVLENVGLEPVTGVEVSDLLPAGVDFVSATATQGSYVAITGRWAVGPVAVAEMDTLAITVTVAAGTAGTTITNTAALSALDQLDANPANDADSVDIDVQAVDVAVTKTVDDLTPDEGGTVVYTVVVDNGGPDTATSVEITDLLPAGVTFVSATVTRGFYSSGTGLWMVDSMVAANPDTLQITATVDTGTSGQLITNTASVTAVDQTDTNPLNDSDSAQFTVAGLELDLAVAKTVDDAVPTEGGTVVYTIVVDNLGPSVASGVEVTDLLPAGVTFISAAATQGAYVAGTGVWTVGVMPVAAPDTLAITATVNSGTAGQVITNTASLTAVDQMDVNPVNDSGSADVTVQATGITEQQVTNDPASDQRPTWSADGTQIGFDSNRSGNADLWVVPSAGGTAVPLTTNPLPDEMPDWSPDGIQIVFSSRTDVGNPNSDLWLVPASGGTPTLLAASAATNDRLPAWSPDGSLIAFSKDSDIYVVPAGGGTPVQLTTHPGTDIHPTWSPDGTRIAFVSDRSGNNDIWTIPVTGGTAVRVTNNFADDNTPDWCPTADRIAFQSNRSGNNDLWIIPVAGGPALQLTSDPTFEVQPDWSRDGSRIAFNRGGNIHTLTLPVCDLSLTKTVDNGMPNAGDTITYTLVVANGGPQIAPDVEVTDELPLGVTFQSALATRGSYDSGSGLWTVGTLGNGASDTLAITAMVDPGAVGQAIVNTAFISAFPLDLADADGTDNADSVTIDVQGIDLAVSLTVDDPTPAEADTIVYTVGLSSAGTLTATGVEVTDVLPVEVTFVSYATTQGTYDDMTGVWTVGAVSPGPPHSLQITTTVNNGTAGVTFTNTAAVTASDQNDANVANNSASVDVTVQSLAITETQITSGAVADQRPSWSPDGTQLAFDSNRSGNEDIWVIPSSGGTATQLTTNSLPDRHPDWSPDGSQIVFAARTDFVEPNGDLLLIPAGGGAPTPLTADPSFDDRLPTWSPDGSLVAYTRDEDIYVVPAGGGTPVPLVTDPSVDVHPTWSPDGSLIAFVSDRGASNDIWIVPATGGTPVQLTTDLGNDNTPDWSPDGMRIAFQSNRTGNNDIWMIPVTGGTAVQLTTDAVFDVQPDWASTSDRIAFNRGGDLWVLSFPTCDVAVTQTVDNPAPAQADTVTFTIVAENLGPQGAPDVEITDVLPVGLTFASASATRGSYDSATGVWAVGGLASGVSATLTLRATVDLGTGGLMLVNGARLTGLSLDVADGAPANNSDTASLTVQSVLAVSSAEDQTFIVGTAPTAISPITVTDDATTPSITAANDLRIRIPVGFQMDWDTSDLAATIEGSAAAKVSGAVTYEDGGKTLVLDVTTDFAGGDRITVSDLTFTGFAAFSAEDSLELEIGNDGVVSALDDKFIRVVIPTPVVAVAAPPALYALETGYPNPFRHSTSIRFDLPASGMTDLTVFDVTGRRVRTLVRGATEAGHHQRIWDGRDTWGSRVAAGVYFVRLQSGEFTATRRLVRLR